MIHGHASSHCSLLWYEKDIVYQQIYVGIKSLTSTSLQSFMLESIRIIELHEHACPIWAVFFHGFPKSILCLFSAHHQTLSPYKVSCVSLLRLVRFASSTGRRR